MNHITIAGHLGADPEVRFTSSGLKVTTLRVAARVRRSGKDETIWWKVTVWGEQFDKIIPFFKKGSPIIVSGELNKPEIFTDREGRPQVSMSLTAFNITFSPFGRPDQAGGSTSDAGSHGHSSAQEPAHMGQESSYGQGRDQGHGREEHSFSDDEIPF